MHTQDRGERLLTELDFVRLTRLNGGHLPPELAEDLEAAELLPSREIPPNVVTMYSQVDLVFAETGTPQRLTLCYPRDAQASQGLISVLSPIGAALLGLQVGDVARWQMPSGEQRAARVVAIAFQPEASGDYTT
ncbi:MAG TPA: GreA/GreB family elongation factor [Aquabacterium sp.]|uniref:GreA/GreB family elongation factor n=1 Tax=Aquabacterium sp. TaxID=1872578 RepID=UPI002E30358E|nr:GreA/GreB family elongation factor [Aquabacterium sp.]HEX5371625.1 GreA/GreB family elongation factor [Aquabacterium sp.]